VESSHEVSRSNSKTISEGDEREPRQAMETEPATRGADDEGSEGSDAEEVRVN